MLAVTLTAAALAACAQSPVTRKSELRAASRQVLLEERQNTPSVMNRGLAAKANKHTPFAANKNAAETQIASYGLASQSLFYGGCSRSTGLQMEQLREFE